MEKLTGILKSIRSDAAFKTETQFADNGVLNSSGIISPVPTPSDTYGIRVGVMGLVQENGSSVQAMAALIARLT